MQCRTCWTADGVQLTASLATILICTLHLLLGLFVITRGSQAHRLACDLCHAGHELLANCMLEGLCVCVE